MLSAAELDTILGAMESGQYTHQHFNVLTKLRVKSGPHSLSLKFRVDPHVIQNFFG